jgi:hypothetical protein
MAAARALLDLSIPIYQEITAMATIVWEPVKTLACARLGSQAALLEKRVYPIDLLDTAWAGFHSEGQRCSHGVECNQRGLACRWSGLNPDYDPFAR